MYRFLDKRFYYRHTLDFDLRTVACKHVGLSRNYPPRRLKPGLRELEQMGFSKGSRTTSGTLASATASGGFIFSGPTASGSRRHSRAPRLSVPRTASW
jgi:hypothetical protein